MSALILDTETTGIEDPQVIELACIGPLGAPSESGEHTVVRFKPSCPIALGAMATRWSTTFGHTRSRARCSKHAHGAGVDVVLCAQLLGKITDDLGPTTWGFLWQLSEKARVPSVMPFGKHKGMPISQVPRDYKQWLLGQPDVDPYLRKALQAARS